MGVRGVRVSRVSSVYSSVGRVLGVGSRKR
jgi:hypothetical protein